MRTATPLRAEDKSREALWDVGIVPDRVAGRRDIAVIGLILGWKALTFVVAFVAWSVLPFNHAMRNANLRWGERDDGSFGAALSTWDSQHYIRIAEAAYQPGLLTNAFSPLFPWLIRALNVVT